jgi:L-ascorbate metabolism protein UlaG (beta-lactamase superfamily)
MLNWIMEFFPAFGKKPSGERLEGIRKSPNYGKDGFQNAVHTSLMMEGASMPRMIWEFMNKPKNTVPPAALPSVKTDLRKLSGDGSDLQILPAAGIGVGLASDPVVVWFGHSSYFIRLAGLSVLVDPVFCGYASPFSFSTKAFAGTDVYGVDDLPQIDMVVITHDHYDHLDYKTMSGLAAKGRHFYTSLGVGSHLEYWGIAKEKITELDWWDDVTAADGITLTAAPARHFSGRGLTRGKTLWSSFVLKAGGYTIYIGGDSGYGPHFKTIGEKFGSMDLVILECGQYGKDWPDIHMVPEDCVQAAQELAARVLLPVHWGKFSLSLHPWDEPVRRVVAAAHGKGVEIATPMIGEPLVLGASLPQTPWWEQVGK